MKNFFKGFFMSLGMFSIIPSPKNYWSEKSLGMVLIFMPLVGLLHGVMLYSLIIFLLHFKLDIFMCAALSTVFFYGVTGFIHLDGFMDSCDAIFSRLDLLEKKRILKDSHVGAFSVICLLFLILISSACFFTIINSSKNLELIILIPVFSKFFSSISVYFLKIMEGSSYAKLFKMENVSRYKAYILSLFILSLGLSYLLFGLKSLLLICAMAIIFFLLILKAKREFCGINGDLCGYAITISELIGLFVLTILR